MARPVDAEIMTKPGDSLIRELEALRASMVLVEQHRCGTCGDDPRAGCPECGGGGYVTEDGIYNTNVKMGVIIAVISLATDLLPETGHLELRRILRWAKRYCDDAFLDSLSEFPGTPQELATHLEANSKRTGIPLHPFLRHVVGVFRSARKGATPREILDDMRQDDEEA